MGFGLQVPEIIIDPYPNNAIFLNFFSDIMHNV